MPVQINELVIKATIVESGDKGSAPATNQAPASPDLNKADIVQECVDLVMEILHNKKER